MDLTTVYLLIATGTCIGCLSDTTFKEMSKIDISQNFIAALFWGLIWPVYWSALITQKLSN